MLKCMKTWFQLEAWDMLVAEAPENRVSARGQFDKKTLVFEQSGWLSDSAGQYSTPHPTATIPTQTKYAKGRKKQRLIFSLKRDVKLSPGLKSQLAKELNMTKGDRFIGLKNYWKL